MEITFNEFLQVIVGLIAFWVGASIGIDIGSKS
jgi:hypothetical protein